MQLRSSYSYAKLSEIRLAGKQPKPVVLKWAGSFMWPLNNTIVITLVDEPSPGNAVKT